jgi:hypothetical protein
MQPYNLVECFVDVRFFILQANNTAVLVHKILTKTRDPEVREEVFSNL